MMSEGSVLSNSHLYKGGLKETTASLDLDLTTILEGNRVLRFVLITWKAVTLDGYESGPFLVHLRKL